MMTSTATPQAKPQLAPSRFGNNVPTAESTALEVHHVALLRNSSRSALNKLNIAPRPHPQAYPTIRPAVYPSPTAMEMNTIFSARGSRSCNPHSNATWAVPAFPDANAQSPRIPENIEETYYNHSVVAEDMKTSTFAGGQPSHSVQIVPRASGLTQHEQLLQNLVDMAVRFIPSRFGDAAPALKELREYPSNGPRIVVTPSEGSFGGRGRLMVANGSAKVDGHAFVAAPLPHDNHKLPAHTSQPICTPYRNKTKANKNDKENADPNTHASPLDLQLQNIARAHALVASAFAFSSSLGTQTQNQQQHPAHHTGQTPRPSANGRLSSDVRHRSCSAMASLQAPVVPDGVGIPHQGSVSNAVTEHSGSFRLQTPLRSSRPHLRPSSPLFVSIHNSFSQHDHYSQSNDNDNEVEVDSSEENIALPPLDSWDDICKELKLLETLRRDMMTMLSQSACARRNAIMRSY